MARLHALPYATLCIDCQREAEKYGDGHGHDSDWGRILDSGSGDSEVTINDIELDVS
jgi:DnaK suppressor protein